MANSALLVDLESLLAEARAKAHATGGPILATAVCPCAAFDPLAVFAVAPSDGRLFWQRPAEDVSLVAVGSDPAIAVDGPGRFQAAKAAWAELVSTAIGCSTAAPFSLPLAFAGFAFSPQVKAPASQPFPAGLLVLPRLLFIASKGQFWLSASVRVLPDTDIPALAEAVRSEITALVSGATCILAARPEAFELETPSDCSAWESSVKTVLGEIDAARVEKVVLARAVRGKSRTPIDPGPVLSRLASRYPQATVFAFESAGSCFLGASPERLVRMFGSGKVSVDCLAGSIGRGEDEASDQSLAEQLLADPKERHEHAVVLRAIEESLAPVCEQIKASQKPTVRQTATVQHLYTPVEAQVRGGHQVLDLVERLHPTPATAGYPREKALALIAEYEGLDRGWYAGPFGWIDGSGNGEFAVAIRSGLINGAEATLYAGSGIVAGSDPDREYEETRLKLRTMSWALQNK